MSVKLPRRYFLKLAVLSGAAVFTGPLHSFATYRSNRDEILTGDDVTYFKKGDERFESLRKGFNKRIDKVPQIIALCHTTAGVAEAMKYAVDNKLPVAVKSGGHCMEGFSSNDGGMVINLSELNSIEWIGNNKVKLGPGCKLSSLYDALLPKKRIIPGGSCAGVAIGGLSLGGGYGLTARNFGLTCDSLTSVTMVDGNGKIIHSSEDNELLWACKGGGNGNFGIITEMEFTTHPAPATMQSFRFKTKNVTAAKAKDIFSKWFAASAALPPFCFSACLLNHKTVYVLLTATDKLTPAVQTFINTLITATETTTKTSAQPLAKALKVYYGRPEPTNFKNASAGLYKNFEEIEPFIESVLQKVIDTAGMIYQVNTLGGNIQKPEFEAASCFPHRAFPFFSELQTYWENEKQGTRLMQKFQSIQDEFAAHNITAQYRNYPDINFKNWGTLYYGSNHTRLQQLKNKYDPFNRIQHAQSIRNA